MNPNSIDFIKQHWKLLYHPSADDFKPLITQTVLQSLRLIIEQLEHDDWRTLGELSEGTNLTKDTIAQITTALRDELFEKFRCPEPGRGFETAVKLIKPRKRKVKAKS